MRLALCRSFVFYVDITEMRKTLGRQRKEKEKEKGKEGEKKYPTKATVCPGLIKSEKFCSTGMSGLVG